MTVTGISCLKHVGFALSPLHAFVGPNDSGKSTLLRTLALAASYQQPSEFPAEVISPADRWSIHVTWAGTGYEFSEKGGHLRMGGAQTLRLEPDALRAPAGLIPANHKIALASPKGMGLVSVCDAIYSRDVDAWIEIRRRFVELFPTAKSLELSNSDAMQKQLGVVLVDGTRITAAQMSEGMLYWLAFATLAYADKPGLFLVEEPENGLHPSRIKQVVDVLRHVSATSQVVIATHSPLVINELQPEEVSIVTRTRRHGSRVTPMRETRNFEQRSKNYALGELWLSYADGELEANLTEPEPTKEASGA